MPTSLAEMVAEATAKAPTKTPAKPAAVVKPETEPESTPEPEAAEPEETTPEPEATEPEETTPEPETPGELSLRDYAKEQFPDRAAIIDKYKDDDELLKGLLETASFVGTRDEKAAFVQRLLDAGITPDDLQGLIENKRTGKAKPVLGATETDVAWNPSWVTENEKGEWVITAEGRRVANIEGKVAAYRAELAAAMRDPAKLLDLIKRHAGDQLEALTAPKLEQVKKQLEDQAFTQLQNEWMKEHAELILGKDKKLTPVGAMVDKLLKDGLGYDKPWNEAADAALEIAIKASTPAPTKRAVPTPAKRQPAVAPAVPVKLTDEEFRKKYKPSFKEFVEWADSGILPTRD